MVAALGLSASVRAVVMVVFTRIPLMSRSNERGVFDVPRPRILLPGESGGTVWESPPRYDIFMPALVTLSLGLQHR